MLFFLKRNFDENFSLRLSWDHFQQYFQKFFWESKDHKKVKNFFEFEKKKREEIISEILEIFLSIL